MWSGELYLYITALVPGLAPDHILSPPHSARRATIMVRATVDGTYRLRSTVYVYHMLYSVLYEHECLWRVTKDETVVPSVELG